jgi:putative tricarboxylic transport membrane protein
MLKPGDVIGGLILLGVSACAIIGGLKLHLGKVSEPQPGFFPFWGGVVLALLSGILLLKPRAALRGAGRGGESFGAIWRPMFMIIGLLAYAAFLNTLGYLIATFILSIVLLRVLGTKKVWGLVFAAFCISLGSYVLFDRLLSVTLPAGILPRFL